MSDTRYCGNPDVLIAYVYEDGDPAELRAFEAHLAACTTCAGEVASLRGVRGSLTAWAPPEAVLDFRIVREPAAAPSPTRWAWMQVPAMPAWAQFAAAALVVGVAVGISGLEVRYDQQGLSVRAGWNKTAAVETAQASPANTGEGRSAMTGSTTSAKTSATTSATATPAATPAAADAPWRTELAALREELLSGRREPGAVTTSAGAGPVVQVANGRGLTDDEFLARVRQLIDASETRQQREFALRLTQVVRDMDTQRRADLSRVANGLGVLEGRTGAVVGQQREMMNYLMRVSQKQ